MGFRSRAFGPSVVAYSLFLLVGVSAYADPVIETEINGLRVQIVLGNIVNQPVDGLIVSHWPEGVNDGGGVGGAIASDPAGDEAIKRFSEQMKAAGGLEYMSVHPTRFEPKSGSQIQAKSLLNVIELRPLSRISFDSLEELEKSDFPFTAQERAKYRELFEKYGHSVRDHQKQAEDLLRLTRQGDEKAWSKLLSLWTRGSGTPFETLRDAIVKPYAIDLGVETTALTVKNALKRAAADGLSSAAVPTLGYGIMGDLDMKQSVAAIITGAQLHAREAGAGASLKELKIVIYASDNGKNRKWVNSNFGDMFRKGEFVDVIRPHWRRAGAPDFEALKSEYLEKSAQGVKGEKVGMWSCVKSAVLGLIPGRR